ncbi:Monooxygenase, FAD-binding [Penicillium expansum]|uniref:Monooxygenase, FAD-binding n=1 Tax=Penicillium expansum TaxID=27334 RepID=A0A0A2IRE1_PENEN|nr:Monooxygenase, FAD-binding [Penicillium expansum]KGO45071.1 Monooxygenase, FAD-binding [Penicillium expansum]KGO55705.1 Monooxygenase, FAD-binding [Penicillium expansum]KGO60228.1 Monooxygenase, FAD-binding [Penicillium expansum]
MVKSTSKDLRVVIVGGGFAGLTAAIECKLRGMHPILVEAYSGASSHGDLLDFVRNAGRVFESWDNGNVGRRLMAAGVNAAKYLEIYNAQNVLLRKDPWPQAEDKDCVYAGHRGEMHRIIYEYAIEVGVDMQFSKRVERYLDSDTERGVLIEGGEKILGDVVLACDGPKSLARTQLLQLPESTVNSGYAIFRAFFNITDEMRQLPEFSEMIKPGEDSVRFWVGRDMHGFIYTWKNGRDCAWVLTHLDDANIAETWSFPGKKEDVSKYLKDAGFPEIWHQVLGVTPDDRIIDYKLVWRDAIPTWLSSSKKCAVMGDAAHCHLPTSAQGACQAVEDAVTAAICLQKCNGDVAAGLQVFERIRFNRSHVIHQASILTRNIYHKNDWTPDLVREYPDSLVLPFYPWVTDFDVFANAEKHFDHLLEDVKSGKPGTIEQLALPAGGNYDAMLLEKRIPEEKLDDLAPSNVVRVQS